MATRTSTEVHFKALPQGIPDESCFGFVKTEVPDAGPGEVLVRNVYMSVDPAMRPPLSNGQQKLDQVMGGGLGSVQRFARASQVAAPVPMPSQANPAVQRRWPRTRGSSTE